MRHTSFGFRHIVPPRHSSISESRQEWRHVEVVHIKLKLIATWLPDQQKFPEEKYSEMKSLELHEWKNSINGYTISNFIFSKLSGIEKTWEGLIYANFKKCYTNHLSLQDLFKLFSPIISQQQSSKLLKWALLAWLPPLILCRNHVIIVQN